MADLFLAVLLLVVVHGISSVNGSYEGSWSYNGTAAEIRNPERGFRGDIDDISSNKVSDFSSAVKVDHVCTVVLAYCYLSDYIGKDIPQAELDAIEHSLNELHGQGKTVILRFAYSKSLKPSSGPTFDDVIRHATSLQPVVSRSANSILTIQVRRSNTQ